MKLDFDKKIIPDAYHGTCESKCNSINQHGFFINEETDLRLGDGVYFYESSYSNAIHWATKHKRCRIGPAVFQALIVVKTEEVLDLHDDEDQKLVEDVAEELKKKYRKENIQQRISDAVVINYICEQFVIHLVRATFTDISKVQKLHPQSKFSKYSQLVICVRNTDIIRDYKQIHP